MSPLYFVQRYEGQSSKMVPRLGGGYRVSRVPPDTSGRVKVDTLEFFVFHDGWHPINELLQDPVLAAPYSLDRNSRAIHVRLARYAHRGLLVRRWRSGEYEYAITTKGEDRIIYLWDKLGYTDTMRTLTEDEKQLMELRLEKTIEIARKQRLSAIKKWG